MEKPACAVCERSSVTIGILKAKCVALEEDNVALRARTAELEQGLLNCRADLEKDRERLLERCILNLDGCVRCSFGWGTLVIFL